MQDIVGEVFVIKTTYNDETQTIQRIMVNIRIEGYVKVSVSFKLCLSSITLLLVLLTFQYLTFTILQRPNVGVSVLDGFANLLYIWFL